MAIFTLKHGTLVQTDGAALTFNMTPGPMDVQLGGIVAGQYKEIPVMNAGEFLELVEGERVFVTFSLTLLQNGKIIDASNGTPFNAARKLGTWAAGTTIDPGGVVWTTNITLTLTRLGQTSTLKLQNCRIQIDFNTAADGNTIKISGTAYGLTGTGAANEPIVYS